MIKLKKVKITSLFSIFISFVWFAFFSGDEVSYAEENSLGSQLNAVFILERRYQFFVLRFGFFRRKRFLLIAVFN